MAAATANPAFAGGTVDIEAGLRDGTLTTEQAFALQERQLRAEMEAREKQLRVEMDAKIAAAQLGIHSLYSPLSFLKNNGILNKSTPPGQLLSGSWGCPDREPRSPDVGKAGC